MPWRNTGLLSILAGTALAVLVIALGWNVHRLARRGPAWRRRILGAGVAMLAWFGVSGCDRGQERESKSGAPERDVRIEPSPNRDMIRRLEEALPVLREATSSPNPDRRTLGKTLRMIDADLNELPFSERLDLLDRKEAARIEELLSEIRPCLERIRIRFPLFATGTDTSPPSGHHPFAALDRNKESENQKHDALICYAGGPSRIPWKDDLNRLESQILCLKRNLDKGRIEKTTARKILWRVQNDLERLGKDETIRQMKPDKRPEAEKIRTNLWKLLLEIRKTPGLGVWESSSKGIRTRAFQGETRIPPPEKDR